MHFPQILQNNTKHCICLLTIFNVSSIYGVQQINPAIKASTRILANRSSFQLNSKFNEIQVCTKKLEFPPSSSPRKIERTDSPHTYLKQEFNMTRQCGLLPRKIWVFFSSLKEENGKSVRIQGEKVGIQRFTCWGDAQTCKWESITLGELGVAIRALVRNLRGLDGESEEEEEEGQCTLPSWVVRGCKKLCFDTTGIVEWN